MQSPEIRFGTSLFGSHTESTFSQSIESQVLKDKNAQFVFVENCGSRALGNESKKMIERKIKASMRAGLPVILGVQAQKEGASLREQLQGYLSDLNEDERKKITIVYQTNSSKSMLMENQEIYSSLESCRRIIREIGGESFATHVKILFSIPKYAPKLLKSCLNDQIDGVCIYPKTLPSKDLLEKEERIKKPIFEKMVLEEEKSVVVESKPLAPTEKKVMDPTRYLSTGKRTGTCLIFCHPYDDFDKTVQGVEKLTQLSGNAGAIDCLFALPYTGLSEIPNYPGVQCGAWGLLFANTDHLNHRVHFDLLKDNGSSFIVIGNRLNRDVSDLLVNQQLKQAISEEMIPIVGVSFGKDLKKQIDQTFQGISSEDAKKIRIVFYAGLFGETLKQEAQEIDMQVKILKNLMTDLYDEHVSNEIKIILEVSHFSGDPMAYLSHKAVDGISLSASAIKVEKISRIKRELQLEEESFDKESKKETVLEDKGEEEKLEEIVKEEVFEEEAEIEETEEEIHDAQEYVSTVRTLSKNAPVIAEENSERRRQEKLDIENSVEVGEIVVEETHLNSKPIAKTVSEGLQLVKLTVDECAERLASKQFQETFIPNAMDLESPDVKLDRMKNEYKKMFEEFRGHAAQGWEVLFKEMEENQEPARDKIINALKLPLEKIMAFTDVETISKELDREKGKLWYEIIGLSKKQISTLYETARGLYEKKLYKESADAFFTLVSLNAKEYGVWFGYGMAKKMEKENFEVALDAFSIANTLKPGSPEPYIHAAECYIELGDISEAKRCLTYGEQLLREGEKSSYLKKWVEQLAEKL